ncbi:hypothetical protein [Glycomyces buryatensis]|uniref:hypothetical protein n=1 Tax=Glycomyces buryatensis TaxID=2570927 RepID=UPI0014562C63|nr:hypothetical protein [Glycomyces buryatensis]
MADIRLLRAGGGGQDPIGGIVPERMDLLDEWVTADDEKIELYNDDRACDAHLILVGGRAGEEQIATLFHSGGVARGAVWHGTGSERSRRWQAAQRRRAAAAIAAHHARPRGVV